MTINQIILTACEPIILNVWANELPPAPAWPAVMFEVETTPETTWVQGGGYDQHTVTLYVLGRSLAQVKTISSQLTAAIEVLPEYLQPGDSGDSDYEDDPDVYAVFITHTLRLRSS